MAVEVICKTKWWPFDVPESARICYGDETDFRDSPAIELEDVPSQALDALAETWLNNLYASVERESPFKLVGGK